MNEELHWNKIGDNYNNEIFDVFRSDKKKRLPFYFKKHANKNHTAIDFGCGNGKSFSHIAPLFKEIIAIDISQELINQAKTRPFTNIKFKQNDLSKRNLKLGPVDFIFCCNVVMLPVIEKNQFMLQNISRALKPKGKAVLVLPALESVMFSSWRLIDWYKREGVKPSEIDSTELDYFNGSKRDIIQGIIYIDKVPTKHYSANELEVLFTEAGLKITALDKVEYDWNSEFSEPPSWMKGPYPWDWLVECKKA
jgi:ubiquinone/menaquinone biosynthesis C-methylase UbiE